MRKLLLPRENIEFAVGEGESTFYVDDIPRVLSRPLIKSRSYGIVKGKESGSRSGLLSYARRMYQIKGCDVPNDPLYTTTGKLDYAGDRFIKGSEPNGGQFLEKCKHELSVVKELSDTLIKEGFVPPQRPVGYYSYHLDYVRPIGASIFENKGDTRLDELLIYLESPIRFPNLSMHVPELYDLSYKLGFWAGRLKRIMDNNGYTWDKSMRRTNAHLGNYVVFNEDGKIMLGPVDLDSAVRWRDTRRMKTMQKFEYNNLLMLLLEPTIISYGVSGAISGNNITVVSGSLNIVRAEYPLWYRDKLKQGFEDGYKNPHGECIILPQDITNAAKAGEELLRKEIGRLLGKRAYITFTKNKVRSVKSI